MVCGVCHVVRVLKEGACDLVLFLTMTRGVREWAGCDVRHYPLSQPVCVNHASTAAAFTAEQPKLQTLTEFIIMNLCRHKNLQSPPPLILSLCRIYRLHTPIISPIATSAC